MPTYAFTGARKDFLESKRPYYDASYDIGDAKNALANILRIYCTVFPLSLPIDEEPTPEEITAILAQVQPETRDAEEEELDESDYSPDEWRKMMREREAKRKALLKLQSQFQGWFSYCYIKTRAALKRKETAQKDHPFAHLFRLLEGNPKKPRQRAAINVWRQGFSVAIEEAATKAVTDAKGNLSKDLAGVRAKTAKEMFDALPEEDREHYLMLAKEEHKAALAAYKAEQLQGPSTTPEARQKCIEALIRVIQPLLDAIVEATGWRVSLIAGGPEPSKNGQMSLIMIHSGTTIGEVKMDWGRFDHKGITEIVMPMFGDFLRKCYSVAECQGRTLNNSNAEETTVVSPPPPPPVVSPPPPPPVVSPPPPPSVISPPPPPSVVSPPPPSPVVSPPLIISPQSPPVVSPSLVASTLVIPSVSSPPELLSQATASNPASTRVESRSRSPSLAPPSRTPSPLPTLRTSPSPPIPQPSHISAAQVIINQHLPPSTSSTDGATGKRAAESTVESLREEVGVKGGKKQKTARGSKRVSTRQEAAKAAALGDSTTSGPSTVEPATNTPHPSWFVDAMDLFVKGAAGLAGAGGFGPEKDKRLPARFRPTVVKDWVARGRTRNKAWRPKDLVPTEFKTEFWTWWTSLQPEWRVDNGAVITGRVDGDWSPLVVPGVNGVLSVVAALFFWGLEAQDKRAPRDAWLVAVRDCTTAFQKLAAVPST
ncbi:hypothetical protein BJ165DRAFT_1528604 [Panaeolus papilionaceus]|nr:hypothetical protein BJ165DRAFT_1528604 [Panaeolus papilionaceus]